MYRPVKVRRVKLNKNKLAMQTKEEPSTTTFLQLTDDCLLVLFTQLTLIEAFKLGSSCRRLYDLYQKAFKDRRSLVLWLPEQFYGMYFYEDIFDSKPFCSVSSANHFLLSKWVAPTRTLFARLPNLVSLEIKNICGFEKTIPYLINYLNTSVIKLQSLKLLIVNTYDMHSVEKEIDAMLAPLQLIPEEQQLQLPLLKHLTLYFDYSDCYFPLEFALNSPIFHSVFPQLNSFHFCTNNDISVALEFLHQNVRPNAQLVAAAESGSENLKTVLILHNSESGKSFCERVENEQLTMEEADGLALVTHTKLDNRFCDIVQNPEMFFNQLFSRMINLNKVIIDLSMTCSDFFVFVEEEVEEKELAYPMVLTALATLPHLKTIELSAALVTANKVSEVPFCRSQMPVLPSVESFSLDDYDSYFHADPLEFLQLEHCFPKLKQISVSIRQYECEYCDYKSAAEDTATFQRCFLKLARGLLRLGKTGGDITAWESAVKVKKADFWFRYFCFFTSLDNLVAGIKKVYKND